MSTNTLDLPLSILRALGDKLYEKRKVAALEIEKVIRDIPAGNGQAARIRTIVNTIISDFAYSPLPNCKNGGLIALAAMAIALGSNSIAEYLDLIVPPILSNFNDIDIKVRYYACESMYNVVKVARSASLKYFNEIFDGLSKLATDPESSVKNGAELLDRLVKDIVCDQAAYYPPELVSRHLGNSLVISDETSISDSNGKVGKSTVNSIHNAAVVNNTTPPVQQIGNLNPTTSHPASNTTAAVVAPLAKLPHTNTAVPGSIPLLPSMTATTFNLPRFIPLLSERINVLNSSTRMFFVQWIVVLASVPDLELISYLPNFLDGLFGYLGDANADVRTATSNVLDVFLKEIRNVVTLQRSRGCLNIIGQKNDSCGSGIDIIEQPCLAREDQHVSAASIPASIGKILSRSLSQSMQAEAHPLSDAPAIVVQSDANYIIDAEGAADRSSIAGANDKILPFGIDSSRPYIQGQGIQIDFGRMTEILVNNLSSNDEETQATALAWISEFIILAKECILPFTSPLINCILPPLSHDLPIRTIAGEANANLFNLISETEYSFDLGATVDALQYQFQDENEETRIASVEWLLMLHRKSPQLLFGTDDAIFATLLKTLSDASEEVVKRDLQLLSQISNSSTDNTFQQFLVQLLSLFASDRRLLDTRGALIIRHLCFSLNPERIYRCFAEVLEHDVEGFEFASVMVQNLNVILMTAPELAETRRRLKNLDTRLFTTLYKSWCHNPVSTFTLCLLSQSYEHASNLLHICGTEMEINVAFLVQIDKLVQLLESPVFTYLRLQLIEPDRYPYLLKCMYGILMLLPQSSAFATLRNRLNSVSSIVGLFAGAGGMGAAFGLPPAPMPGPSKRDTTTASASSSSSSSTRKNGNAASTAESSINAGGGGAGSAAFRWNDLLTHFRTVQSRHERSLRHGSAAAVQEASLPPPPLHPRNLHLRNNNGSAEFRMALPVSAGGDGGIRNTIPERRGSKLATSPTTPVVASAVVGDLAKTMRRGSASGVAAAALSSSSGGGGGGGRKFFNRNNK